VLLMCCSCVANVLLMLENCVRKEMDDSAARAFAVVHPLKVHIYICICYMCVYICIHTYIFVRTYIHIMYVCGYIYTHTHMYV
jgi:hypothetical protein